MLSYHNDPAVKTFHVAQARHHLEADMLRSGTYGEGRRKEFHACRVGCMAHDIDLNRTDFHVVVASHAGWPEWLVRLNDEIFEGLPSPERNTFHAELRETMPIGELAKAVAVFQSELSDAQQIKDWAKDDVVRGDA